MAASDMVIIPVEPSQLSLRNIQLVNAAVRRLRQSLNPQVQVRYVLSKVAQRRETKKMARIARRVLVEAFGESAVLRTEIPHLPIFQSAINVSEPMVIHAKRSRAANITRQFARELTGMPLRRSHYFLPPIRWQKFSKAN